MYEDFNFDDVFEDPKTKTVTSELRELLPNFGERKFTVQIVRAAREKVGLSMKSAPTISRLLNLLAEQGFIICLHHGKGSHPSIYQMAPK